MMRLRSRLQQLPVSQRRSSECCIFGAPFQLHSRKLRSTAQQSRDTSTAKNRHALGRWQWDENLPNLERWRLRHERDHAGVFEHDCAQLLLVRPKLGFEAPLICHLILSMNGIVVPLAKQPRVLNCSLATVPR